MPDNFYTGEPDKTGFFATSCNLTDPKPLTIEAMKDAILQIQKQCEGPIPLHLQPSFLVMTPKRAKTYERRYKRRRHRDKHLLVMPYRSWYQNHNIPIKPKGPAV